MLIRVTFTHFRGRFDILLPEMDTFQISLRFVGVRSASEPRRFAKETLDLALRHDQMDCRLG